MPKALSTSQGRIVVRCANHANKFLLVSARRVALCHGARCRLALGSVKKAKVSIILPSSEISEGNTTTSESAQVIATVIASALRDSSAYRDLATLATERLLDA